MPKRVGPMVNLSRYKDFIEKGIVYVATSDMKCKPNLICVMGCKLVVKDQIIITDNAFVKTRKNLLQNRKVSVVCGRGHDWFQLKGIAAYHNKGKWLDFVKALPANKQFHPNGAVLVTVSEVYDLWNSKRLV